MSNETWLKTECAKCQSKNWVCLGDVMDFTVGDVEACKCWHCSRIFWLGDPQEAEIINKDIRGEEATIEDSYYVMGLRYPVC